MNEKPTDFVSYMDYLGLTGDEIRRLQQEADAEAEALYAQQTEMLPGIQSQAQATGGDVTGVVDYGKYMDLETKRRELEKRALSVADASPEEAIVRRANAPSLRGGVARRESSLQANKDARQSTLDRRRAEAARMAADLKREQGLKTKALADQQNAFAKARRAFLQKMRDNNTRLGAEGATGLSKNTDLPQENDPLIKRDRAVLGSNKEDDDYLYE